MVDQFEVSHHKLSQPIFAMLKPLGAEHLSHTAHLLNQDAHLHLKSLAQVPKPLSRWSVRLGA
jgi:hypothetical protein